MSADGALFEEQITTVEGAREAEWNRTDELAVAALALHGPIDIALTAAGRRLLEGDPEGNPVVHALGERNWLIVKALAISGAGLAWWLGRDSPYTQVPLAILVALGTALVVPNAVVILLALAEP